MMLKFKNKRFEVSKLIMVMRKELRFYSVFMFKKFGEGG